MKILKIALLILSLVLIITSCSKKQTSSDATDETTSETTSSNAVIDNYELQIEYYSELLTSLQDDLSELKADKFMLEANYKAEIEELKKEIDELKKGSSSGTSNGASGGASGGTSGGNSGGTSSGNTTSGDVDHNVYPEEFDPTATDTLYKYEVINKKLTLTEYIGNKLSVKIPQTVDGVSILKIGDDAFKDSTVQSVVIADGIEEIGWFAFWGCSSLKYIEIPSSVTLVGYGAFEYCSPALTIICEKGSYIDIYAQSWGIPVLYK